MAATLGAAGDFRDREQPVCDGQTSQQRSTSSAESTSAGMPLAFRVEAVDGMDVFCGESSRRKAVAHCRSGDGPYILEIKTYRYAWPFDCRTLQSTAPVMEVRKCATRKDARTCARPVAVGPNRERGDLKAIDQGSRRSSTRLTPSLPGSPRVPAFERALDDIYAD